MDYSNNPNVVFVAIPKTGTRSVVDYLSSHLGARKFKGTHTHTVKIPQKLKNYFSFTVVRNPFDRMASYWWSACMRPNGSQMGFEDFLKTTIDNIGPTNIKRSQYPYIIQNKIDKIIKFENLNEEFKRLPFFIEGTSLNWLNSTVKSWNGISPRPPTSELLTPKIQNIIRREFAKDFEVCGYTTEYNP